MSEVNWQDPPPIRGGRGIWGAWERRLEGLKEQPGRWALVGVFNFTTACGLSKGKYRLPSGRWEFTSRKNGHEGNAADIYARYLGPEEAKS